MHSGLRIGLKGLLRNNLGHCFGRFFRFSGAYGVVPFLPHESHEENMLTGRVLRQSRL